MSIEHGSAPEGNPTAVSAVTKAVTVDQPYASLIAHGVKKWETRTMPFNGLQPEGVRGLPGCKVERGERIAIHASAKVPASQQIGAWDVNSMCGMSTLSERGHGDDAASLDLPFGAIIATAVVGEAMQVHSGAWGVPPIFPALVLRAVRCGLALWRWDAETNSATPEDISDQLPFGHWVPGNWAMELLDVELLPFPHPCKGSQGVWRLERAGVVL